MQRRTFLQLAPAAFALPRLRLDRPKVALIGCGWYGQMDLWRLIQVAEVEIVALCDVDSRQLDATLQILTKRLPAARPKRYTDYRRMLERERPEIVMIETPDHWHALQAVHALESGAHLYLQKPVGCDVRECEAVLDAARRHDRVVQVALQRRSTHHLRRAKEEIIEAGRLGSIHHAEMCCYYHMRDTGRREVQAVPDHFDYDRWTGPAPLLPFRGVPHRRWRAFEAYGNGIVGDMCVHMFDMARWMLGLGWPARVSSQGGIYVQTEADATTTDTQSAVFEYPDRELNLIWQHRSWGPPTDPDFPWALFLYGEKGTLKADPYKYHFTPHGGETEIVTYFDERERYPEDQSEKGIEIHAVPAVRTHLLDFLSAIDSGGRPVADIEAGYISSASCILANKALEAGKPLSYDPEKRTLVGADDGLLVRKYREGYVHPGKY